MSEFIADLEKLNVSTFLEVRVPAGVALRLAYVPDDSEGWSRILAGYKFAKYADNSKEDSVSAETWVCNGGLQTMLRETPTSAFFFMII